MSDKQKSKKVAPAAKRASKAGKSGAASKAAGAQAAKLRAGTRAASAKAGKAAAKVKSEETKTRKQSAKKVVAPAAKRAAKSPAATKAKTPTAKARKTKAKAEKPAGYRIGELVFDPIGDASDGEGHAYLCEAEPSAETEMEAYRLDTATDAMDETLEAAPELSAVAAEAAGETAIDEARETGASTEETGDEAEAAEEPHLGPEPPAQLERLQKILSKAGIASRRRAEEMITAGRVIVNGQVVTQLGSKADPARDHIRVDGKLLHGAERHRYFVLNKPRGFVTTVSDPEGRPTVMQFFAKMQERLYPVGRLDFQSEGLLLMTNDGELANLLTKAASGVEKTYVVKVAGQPSEEQLDRLRGGVAIERSEAGSARIRTAAARIRRLREGENPWLEVVLTEGRNRELRKMFAAIGHFAEKIRRVGYGPLALDVEPGEMRELSADEVNALRLTAEGKLKPRRIRTDQMLSQEAGRTAETRDNVALRPNRGPQRRDESGRRPFERPGRSSDRREGRRGGDKGPFERKERREPLSAGRGERPRWQRDDRGPKKEWRPREGESRRAGNERPQFRGDRSGRPEFRREEQGRPQFLGAASERPKFRGAPSDRPQFRGDRSGRPQFRREEQGRPQFPGAASERPQFRGAASERPQFRGGPRREQREGHFEGKRPEGANDRPFRPQGERPYSKRGGENKGSFGGVRNKGFSKGAKPGGFANNRGGGGRKFGGSRPGAQRGGRKRG